MKKTELKAIDFCCGAGGMTFGLRQAGIHVLGGIDSDQNCAATYEKNNKGTTFLHADISDLTAEDICKTFGVRDRKSTRLNSSHRH